MTSNVSLNVSFLLIRLASLLVPRDRRGEWLEEWRGELTALKDTRAAGVAGLPSLIGFAVGSLPHAMWMRTEGWTMDGLFQDLKYSARVLRQAPGFTVVAALTLALGIGANASIFALVNGLVLRAPAGVQDADRLVQIARSYESAPRWDNFSWPALNFIGESARTLSGVAGYQNEPFVMGRGSETERVLGQIVTGSYFDVLGIRPHVGRLLTPADNVEPGTHPVVVFSHALWTRRYGADPSIVGSTVQIGAQPYEVIGVTPEGFAGIRSIGARPGLFVPTMMRSGDNRALSLDSWGSSWINVVGRLADDVTFEEARASMQLVSARLREVSTINRDMTVLLAEGVGLDPGSREQAEQISFILVLIVGLVLLLTCTNVANLSLSRATTRRTEIGVRMALGAGRSRLIRHLVTESALLAVGATVLAIPIVFVSGDFLPLMFPSDLSVSLDADGRVYTFLVGIGLVAGLLFGVVPAWAASRHDMRDALREGASTGPRAKTRLSNALVVSQLALSLGLVAGAALLGRSVFNARMAQPGFNPSGLVAGMVGLEASGRFDGESGRAFFAALIAEAERLPGIRSATLANQLPIAGGHSRSTVRPVGRDDVDFEAEFTVVWSRYFETMGIPILRGRTLGGFDDEPERVVVVNDALASMFWPGEDPIGKELQGDPTWRVVGLVPDVQMRSLRSAGNPGVYYPASQGYRPTMALILSGENDRARLPETIRRTVATIDPELPVSSVVDLQAAMTESMGETRTIGYLLGVFAALALLLASVGLYGLVSYGASQRVREFGIRIALGAEPESLVRLILRRGLVISVLGIGLGLVISYGLGVALQSLLFGVSNTDGLTFGVAAAVLMTVGGVAAWLPARRASKVDAAISLRDA